MPEHGDGANGGATVPGGFKEGCVSGTEAFGARKIRATVTDDQDIEPLELVATSARRACGGDIKETMSSSVWHSR